MFKPNANATKRTKNRFREHTVIPLKEEQGPMSKHFREFADNVHGFVGRTGERIGRNMLEAAACAV